MLVALPILVIGALLYLADRRARRGLDRNDEAGDATNATSDDDTPSSSAGGAGQGSS